MSITILILLEITLQRFFYPFCEKCAVLGIILVKKLSSPLGCMEVWISFYKEPTLPFQRTTL